MVLTGLIAPGRLEACSRDSLAERATSSSWHRKRRGCSNHNYIGTEHILLGLLGEPESIGGTVLASFGMTRDSARAEVERGVGRGKKAPAGHIPFTPRAKKTLELSLREALAIKHNYIGTEHILLGLIREGEGVAAQIMRNHADLAEIRAAVLSAVSATRSRRGAEPKGPRRPTPCCAGCGSG